MLRLAADENFNNDIVRGVLRREADIDFVRVQDAGLSGANDPAVLAWAATEGRLLFTHDVSTMSQYAYHRVDAEQPMPGLFEVRRGLSIREVIDDIVLIATCSLEGEWEGQVRYLLLR